MTIDNGRIVAAGMADSHAGHLLGLCNPMATLTRADARGNAVDWRPELTETQRLLWHLYSNHGRRAVEFAAGAKLYLLHAGDPVHGERHPLGLMQVTREEQIELADWNLRPWEKVAAAIRLVHGTAAHVLADGVTPAETHLAGRLRARGVDAAAYFHERATLGGVIFDVAHHGPNESSRWWLSGNNARYYLRDRMDRDGGAGKAPARVYVRGHYHTYVHERLERRINGRWHVADLVVLPSYCGFTDHARQVTQSAPEICNGMVLFELVGGDLAQVLPLLEYTDLRVEECLE